LIQLLREVDNPVDFYTFAIYFNGISMDSREQFLKTINHIEPGRIVVDLGATSVTGIHVKALAGLREYLGLENSPVRVIEPFQMLGEVGEDLMEILGIDIVGAWGRNNMFGIFNHAPFKEWKTPWGQIVLVPEGFNVTRDADGNTFLYPEGDMSVPPSAKMPRTGYFFDAIIRQKPVVEEELNPDNNLEEFGLITESDLAHWNAEAERVNKTGRAVIGSFGGTALGDIALVPAIQLKNPKGIRDVAEWYMSTLIRPDYIKSIYQKQVEIAIENLKSIHSVVGNKVDALFICGTDFGTQESTFCSPDQFDDLWLPYYKKINDWVHQNTSWKTFKHSCGAVKTLLDHFIRAGFDIINPVQINASGMDPQKIKDKYGKNLVFWGGGIDTQKMLPYGTPEQIREHVLRNCEIFNKGGGFVFNTVHNIQANVPVENIIAMFDAIKIFNGR
jgi:hypothetical protein